MSVTIKIHGGWGIGTFVNASHQGPDWLSLPIDSRSTASQLKLAFTFEGMAVEVSYTGSFPESPADLGKLSAVSSSMVSGVTFTINGQLMQETTFSPSLTISDVILQDDSTDFSSLQRIYSGNDVFISSTGPYSESDENDWIDGYAGDDTFYVNYGNYLNNRDGFYGNSGIDKAVFSGTMKEYTFSHMQLTMNYASGMGGMVHDNVAGRNGDVLLLDVERLVFSDAKKAMDIDGNAGKVAKILGTVFGAAAVSNKQYAGIGLELMDGGMTYRELAALAIDAAGAKTREAVVDLLWTNLVGTHPTTQQAQPFVDMLAPNLSNVGDLGTLAADFAATIGVVNLGTLNQTGLDYI